MTEANDGKRLYIVRVESEFAVLASSEEDAKDIARREALPVADVEWDLDASRMNRMPNGWDEDCLVYGPREDVRLGDAPGFKEIRGMTCGGDANDD